MLANRTVSLLRSFAKRLPSNGVAIRLGSSGSRRPPPITVTAAPKAHAKAHPRETQMPANLAHPVLEGLSVALDKGTVRGFVQELKALANSPTTKPQPELLVDLMDGMVDQVVSSLDVADWFSSLGKLGFQASIPKQRALIVKSVEQLCRAKGMNIFGLSMSLDGLLKTDIKLSDLPDELSSGLMKVIDQAADQMDPRGIANVLKALGKLGATWSLLPTATQKALWHSFEKNAVVMEQSVTSALTIHSFGQLGLDSSTLTNEQRQLVFMVAVKGINADSPGQSEFQLCQQNAMTILGLGKMGAEHASLSDELRVRVESCLLHIIHSMDAQGVSSVIYAFGLMGWQWTTVSPELQVSFQHAVFSQLRRMSLQSMFMTFHGLANMDAKWTKLMPEIRKVAEQALIAKVQPTQLQGGNSAKQVTISIHSLGKMGALWQSFSPAFHEAVSDTIIMLQDKLIPHSLSNFIYGLGCMGASFEDLNPAFMTAVQKTVHRLSGSAEPFQPQDISNILLGFARMRASWDQLPAKELEHLLITLAPKMSAQEVGNSMYGLTLMCFDFQPTSMGSSPAELEKEQLMSRMIRALVKRFQLLGRDEYDREHIQFAISFEWLSGLPGGKKLITEELGSRPVFINPDGVQPPNPLHLALSQALPKALQLLQPAGQFHIANEFDGLGGHVFAMDMAVHQDGKLIAFVEVSGAHHYGTDGNQRKRNDELKEFLYAQRYPGVAVHRVKNYQIMSKGADAFAVELVQSIFDGPQLVSAPSSSKPRRVSNGANTRKIKVWTFEEEEALRDAVAKYGPGHWQKILNDPQFKDKLANRTNENLRDKYRK